MSDNVIARVESWLNGCRAGCPWIGPNWQDNNWCLLRSISIFPLPLMSQSFRAEACSSEQVRWDQCARREQ